MTLDDVRKMVEAAKWGEETPSNPFHVANARARLIATLRNIAPELLAVANAAQQYHYEAEPAGTCGVCPALDKLHAKLKEQGEAP